MRRVKTVEYDPGYGWIARHPRTGDEIIAGFRWASRAVARTVVLEAKLLSEAKAEGEIHSPPGRSAPSIGSTPRIGLTSDGAREPNNETINLG